MQLDIRYPIGLLFTIMGLTLAVYGALSDPAIYDKSLGTNVNLIWGLVMAAFGFVMLILAARPKHAPAGPPLEAPTSPAH